MCVPEPKSVTLNLVVEQFGSVKRILERLAVQRVSRHVGT
jgi:hypothetical protein